MTTSLLDLSRQHELTLHSKVIADLQSVALPLGIVPLIAGAFARDVHLTYAHQIDTFRRTEDIDFAIAVRDWSEFDELKNELAKSASFEPWNRTVHRFRHRTGIPIDLIPFDRIETPHRTIAWPPENAIVMDVFGFREASEHALELVLPNKIRTRVVSLAALALLKMMSWKERHMHSHGKDAHDLYLILRNYLQAGNEERLWREFADWTSTDSFDYEAASARMLGHDVRALLAAQYVQRVETMLYEHVDPDGCNRLPNEMDHHQPDRARLLLEMMHIGFREASFP